MQTASDIRRHVVEMAASQVGTTDPTPYWLDAFGHVPDGHRAWCGIFCLCVLRRCELTDRQWVSGLGFIYCDDKGHRCLEPYLPIVATPEPGDICYIDQPHQHYGIVEEVDASGGVHLIAGNTPNVARQMAPVHGAIYYSIAPLVSKD